MKFIHTGDIHLGSKMEAKLPKEKTDIRRSEVRDTFLAMVAYAREHDISVMVLAGDVFDSDQPLKRDKEFFYHVVKSNPGIDFLYLKGNHDSGTSYEETHLSNLKTFQDTWTSYSYGDTVFWGIELGAGNMTSFYNTFTPDPQKINVVILHGQEGSGEGTIRLKELKDKHIAYLALGHIHKYMWGNLEPCGIWVYPGCPEGRGFDETGEKGFVEVDTQEGVTHKFIPCCRRVIWDVEVDVTDKTSHYETGAFIQESLTCSANDLARITLVGETNMEGDTLTSVVEECLKDRLFFVNVKNKTTRPFSIGDYTGDLSLGGEFVRRVWGDDTLTEEEKKRVIQTGLLALIKGEVDL